MAVFVLFKKLALSVGKHLEEIEELLLFMTLIHKELRLNHVLPHKCLTFFLTFMSLSPVGFVFHF